MFTNLLNESFAADSDECWECERTATPVRRSLREITSILVAIDVEQSHGIIWDWSYRIIDNFLESPAFRRAELSCSPSEREAF